MALVEALEKIKGGNIISLSLCVPLSLSLILPFSDMPYAELMVLGFISLLLTFGQNYITRVCIPDNISRTMLPCELKEEDDGGHGPEAGHRRRLLYQRRILAGDSPPKGCKEV